MASDIHSIALERFDRAWESDRENRRLAVEDISFRTGEGQWPEHIKQQRKEEDRPTLTINKTGQFVRQITGDMRQARPAIKVRGVDDQADPELAEIQTGLIRAIENQSSAKVAYKKGADNQVVCGIGNWRIDHDYVADDVFDQDLLIKPIKYALAVLWDPAAIMPTGEDAKYCFIIHEMQRADYEEEYPNHPAADFKNLDGQEIHGDWYTQDTVRVAEYFWKEPKKKTIARLVDGSVVEITEENRAELQPYIEIERERDSHVVKRVMLNAAELISKVREEKGKYIPIVRCVGEEIEVPGNTIRHGIIRYLKEPSQIYNYWRTAQTEQAALQPKSPYVGTDKMFAKHRRHWENANRTSAAYLPYTPDDKAPGAAPRREMPPQLSPAMSEQVQIADNDMNATTGIYPPALGQKSNETSGVAIRARQMEGDVGSFVYMDNWTQSIEYTGKILVDLIPHYYDGERTVRVLGEDGSEKQVLINGVQATPQGLEEVNDLTTGKYDTVVEVGPSYTTKRQEAAEGMREFLRSVPTVGPLIADLFVKAMDWPMADDIAARIKKTLPEGIIDPEDEDAPQVPEGPNPIEQMQIQMGIDREQAEIDEIRSKAELNDASAEAKRAEAGVKSLSALAAELEPANHLAA